MSNKPQAVEIHDGREDMPVFIHSALDDYGLTAIEFRVYARLARRCGRGSGYESVPSMAKCFEVSDRTIQRSIRVLVRCNLITEKIRPGQTNLYTLNPQSLWFPSAQIKAIRAEVCTKKPSVTPDTRETGDTTDTGGVTQGRGVGVTPQTDEGTPSEGTPIKEIQEIDIRERVDSVFQDYCETVKKVGRTEKRLSLIKVRLLEGKSESQLHSVWLGALRDPWPERKLHNDIIHLLETPERIERMIELSTIELPENGNGAYQKSNRSYQAANQRHPNSRDRPREANAHLRPKRIINGT